MTKQANSTKPTAAALAVATLAGSIFAAAEAQGKADAKMGMTMKEKLTMLMGFTPEQHREFILALKGKEDAIDTKRQELKHTSLRAFYDSGTEAGSIAASTMAATSLWRKLSLACEAGWKPELSKGWTAITQSATAFNADAKAKAELERQRKAQADVVEALKKVGAPEQDLKAAEQKLEELKKDDAKPAPAPNKGGKAALPVKDKAEKLAKDEFLNDANQPKPERQLAEWVTQMVHSAHATLAEIDEIINNLQKYRQVVMASAEQAGKDAAAALKKAGTKTTSEKTGVPDRTEKATARGERRTAKQ
jgi:hypothetical protein